MSLEPVGIFVVLVGLLCLVRGSSTVAFAFVLMTSLAAASVLNFGGNSLTPSHVFLVFLTLAVFSQRDGLSHFLEAFRPPRAGFWLACLVLYGVLGAIFLPRLLNGATTILPLASMGEGDPTIQLQPVSSNFTNSVYMLGNLICFGLIYAVARKPRGFVTMSNVLTAFAALVVVFAAVDLATYSTGTEWLLEPIRNADYKMHVGAEVFGLKRVVGSYVEASSFAGVGLALIGFTATMWLFGEKPFLHGLLAIALIAFVVLSTSTTGLAGLPVVLVALYFTAIQISIERKQALSSGFVIVTPILVTVAVFGVLLLPGVLEVIMDFIDTVVLSKADTDSGQERGSWNAMAYQAFIDTNGVGVGFGTTRASSLLLAILSSTGVLGLLFYLGFIATGLFRVIPRAGAMAPVQIATRNACIGSLLGNLVTSTSVDQGLLFYALAAFAAVPLRELETYRDRHEYSPVSA